MKTVLAFLFLTVSSSFAVDIYVAQNATGSGNGSSAANATGLRYFKGNIAPGTTVHLCGTISSSISMNSSGTAGSPITILFEPGAIMSAPSWTTGAILCSGQSHIVIDGGKNGVLTATGQNSTTGKGSDGIHCEIVSDIEVKNLAITHIYDKTVQSDTASNAGAGVSVDDGTSISVHDCVIHSAGTGIWYGYEGGKNSSHINFYKNRISDTNWGIGSGDRHPNAMCNDYQIHDNDITMGDVVWDDPGDVNHHNGMYVWGEQGGSVISNFKIYNNYVHGHGGSNATAYIFVSCSANIANGMNGILIYNNLLVAPGAEPADGCIFTWCNGFKVYNNTAVATGPTGSIAIREYVGSQSGTSGEISNNVFYNWGAGGSGPIYDTVGVSVLTQTNNLINVDPKFVNGTSDFHLSKGSPAMGTAKNLYTVFTADKDGNTRPISGAWDSGAYELKGATTPTP